MKLLCKTSHLSDAVNTVQKAVSSNTNIPALAGVLIIAEKDKATLICNNLEICIECVIPAEVLSSGRVLVNSRLFFEIVRKITNDEIKLSLSDNILTLETDTSSFEIPSMNDDDFPLPEEFNESYSVTLTETDLREMIRSTIFSAGINSSKVILTGCLFEFSEGKGKMVAVDGYRLAIRSVILPENKFEGSFVVPARALSELLKILRESDDNLYISFSDKNILFEFENIKFATRVLDGEFVDYRKIIPEDFTTTIFIDKSELENALEQVSIMVINDRVRSPLEIKISKDNVEFYCVSGAGKARRIVNSNKIVGEELRIGFNNKFLLDAVKNCNEDSLCLSFGSPVSPCLFHQEDGEDFKFLVLPVRLKDEI